MIALLAAIASIAMCVSGRGAQRLGLALLLLLRSAAAQRWSEWSGDSKASVWQNGFAWSALRCAACWCAVKRV